MLFRDVQLGSTKLIAGGTLALAGAIVAVVDWKNRASPQQLQLAESRQ